MLIVPATPSINHSVCDPDHTLDSNPYPIGTQRYKWFTEGTKGSRIHPEFFDIGAITFIQDQGNWEVHEALGWNVSTNWQTRRPHNFGGLMAFNQETGEIWQGKPGRVPEGMNGKYLAPVGIGARAYLPPVGDQVRAIIGQRHGVTVPSVAECPQFWTWLEGVPEIPIIKTEGGKKALCLLSLGYVAIAGFGVDSFSRKGEGQLLPELRPFVSPERRWIIAFDEDVKRKTRRRVRKATVRLCRYLAEAGAPPENVLITEWDPAQGKGVDDLVVQSGADALHHAIVQAVPFPAWKRGGWDAFLRATHPELFGLIHTPSVTLNQRYLPELQLPTDGGILIVDSPMATGKTEVMKGFIAQARAVDPDCLIELIGYRNALGKQSAQRLAIDHIHDLQGTSYGQTYIDTAQGLAYCLDSLHRRSEQVLKAIANGRRVLALVDEVDAVLKHALLGATLGNRRGEILTMLCELLRAVVNGGGWIVAGEADLTSLPINFLERVTGQSAQVVTNRYQGSPWRVEAPIPSNSEGAPSPALMGKAAIARILDELEDGRRVVAPTDSAQWGELLGRMAIARGCKVMRLDGSTSEEPWAHEFMQTPDPHLTQERPQLLIFTPTGESGLSITGPHFDVMVAYGSHLEHRAILQLMGRIRADIPRVVYCRESSLSDESGLGADPDSILKTWSINARASAMAAKLGDDAPSLDMEGIALLLHEYAAKYQARINGSQTALRTSLLVAMEALGHQVTPTYGDPVSQTFSEELAEAREAIELERATAFATADATGYLDAQGRRVEIDAVKARRILGGTGATAAARVSAQKCITLDAYPGLPVDEVDFVGRCITKARGRELKAHTALFVAMNPAIAQAIDRLSWQAQATNKILWLPSIAREAPKALLIEQSGLLELFALTEYREDAPQVQAVKTFALRYQADIKRVLGLWCAENHTGIQIVNKLSRRLGMAAKSRKEGARGEQVRVWCWSEEGKADRAAIHEALTQKWRDFLRQFEEAPTPVSTISDSKNPTTEIVDTPPGPLPSTVILGGCHWTVLAIEEGFATIIRADAPQSAPMRVPLSRLPIAA